MISFITPYLSGKRWLEMHLSSIRKFHPDDEIIICATDNSAKEIVKKYNGRYFNNNEEYYQAVEFMFSKSSNDTIVLSDNDTVLLSNIKYLADKLSKFEIIGVEEKIRNPIQKNWHRYAPGYMDMTFFMFSKAKFKSKIKDWPKIPSFEFSKPNLNNTEPHYSLCEIFPKHYYLLPYHITRYGLGNLVKDGNKQILYHQWYGSWEKRGSFMSEKNPEINPYPTWDELKSAERRFQTDYPNPDFSKIKRAL